MFRSFFPEPKLFFLSAALWMLFMTIVGFTVGDSIRGVIGVDRFIVAATCAPVAEELAPTGDQPTTEAPDAAATPQSTGEPAAGAAETNPNAPATAESAAPAAAVAAVNCTPEGSFLSQAKIWEYQLILMIGADRSASSGTSTSATSGTGGRSSARPRSSSPSTSTCRSTPGSTTGRAPSSTCCRWPCRNPARSIR